MLMLTISGKPIAQARPRFVRRGKFVSTYNPQETEAGKFLILAKSQLPAGWVPVEGPVMLDCTFDMPIPQSKSKRVREAMIAGEISHTSKPDGSNLIKFLEDALNGVIWVDDAQIISQTWHKRYSENPKTTIRIWSVEA